MAYIAGAQAAREAVKAMADVADELAKVSAITANLMEELRTLAHPSASLGAAEVVSALVMPSLNASARGYAIGRVLLNKIADLGVTLDQSEQFMTEALSEVTEIPQKESALAGFSSYIGPGIFVFLQQARAQNEGTTK